MDYKSIIREDRLDNEPNYLTRIQKWEEDAPVVHEILSILVSSILDAKKQDKESVMKVLSYIHAYFAHCHTDYFPVSFGETDDEKKWNNVDAMELVLLDCSQLLYDILAVDMGKPSLDEEYKARADKQFAEEPLEDDSKSVAVDDGLPF